MYAMNPALDELRGALDRIDGQIVDGLAERERVIDQISSLKLTEGRLRDTAREEELLTRLVDLGRQAGLDAQYVTRLFREILDHSVRRQQERLVDDRNPSRYKNALRVFYQGTEGAYSHLAACRHFGPRQAEVEYCGCNTFEEMLDAVGEGRADYAVLPIENTTAGSINEAYDLLARKSVALVGEEILEVDHCLLALEDLPLSRIRRIYSHPKALDQCTEFLRGLSHCQVESYADTAMAARKVRDDQDLSQAAIASEQAARLYGLTVIRRGIANNKENFTRFVVVAREPVQVDPRIACKTSVVLATRHEEGALLKCLSVLHAHQLNLTKLESRPRPQTPWEYIFYIDFEGSLVEPRVQDALLRLAAHTSFLKVLGSYPARTTGGARPAEPRPAAGPMTASPFPAQDAVPTEPETLPTTHADVLKELERKPYKLVARTTRMQDSQFRIGRALVGGDRPVIIAGPCSVESREQILACARIVKELGGHVLRGGCFKPRTSPYAFQGLGYEALDLLEEAGKTFELPIVTEVMHPADLQAVARKADVIQLGARNMQNFSLLKECGRIDRPIMLKRGMMASIDEWLAAAEYILAHGNHQVILCERGIRTFETATRNTLDLSAVPVVKELTHLPIIVDPSHACGVWRWVPEMTKAALAAGAHGVMVEIHPDPSKALSDGPQALDFEVFRRLMQQIAR